MNARIIPYFIMKRIFKMTKFKNYKTEFIFFDRCGNVSELKSRFSGKKNYPKISFIEEDVREIIKKGNFTAIVSPANSFGFMDGGIDYFYSRILFPGVEPRVKKKLKSIGLKTSLDRYYLPIGAITLVKTKDEKCPFMIVAPTMIFPGNVKGTENPYWVMSGILRLLSHYKNREFKILIPGLGTGCGSISWEDFAQQIERAFEDPPEYDPDDIIQDDKHGFILRKCACKQPEIYANKEVTDVEQ